MQEHLESTLSLSHLESKCKGEMCMSGKNIEPLMRIIGEGHIAIKYGLEEAIFLDSIIYWWRTNRDNQRNFEQGRFWTYNTMKTYAERFPWWTEAQLRRIIGRCKDKGALLVGNFNEDQRDRTLWYSPSDELLALYGEISAPCNCANEQMQVPEQADSSDENSEALPCNYHVATDIPPSIPQKGDKVGDTVSLFEKFWELYPKKKGKEKAQRAWQRLKPDERLYQLMTSALELDKQSETWCRENGRFIPYPASWLNGRRWEDEHQTTTPQADAPLRGEGVRYL